MVFLSSLTHALRESAERALAHFRPPGPIKHGGAVPWKQHLRPLSSTANSHTFVESSKNSCKYQQSSIPVNSVKDPLNNLFRVIREHAIEPVFLKGLKTKTTIAHQAAREGPIYSSVQNSYHRKAAQRTFQRSSRPRVRDTSHVAMPVEEREHIWEVGLQLARRQKWRPHQSISGNVSYVYHVINWSPSLGLRAAVDELEDEMRSWGREEEKKRMALRPNTRRTLGGDSSVKKSKPVNFFQRVPQSDFDAYWDEIDSMPSSLDEEDCDTCSSAYVHGVVSLPESDTSDDDYSMDLFAQESETVSYKTTLQIPLSPDVFRLLAGDMAMQDRDHTDGLDYLHQIQGIIDDFNAFRLNVLVPLERGLQDGHLSLLHPQGWNAGQLFWDSRGDGHPYLPIDFFNCTRGEVLAMLQFDVGPRLYGILVPCVSDDIGVLEDIIEEYDTGEEDDEEDRSLGFSQYDAMEYIAEQEPQTEDIPAIHSVHRIVASNDAGDQLSLEQVEEDPEDDSEEFIITSEDITTPEDEDSGTETPMERSRSTVDFADDIDNRFGPSRLNSFHHLVSPSEFSSTQTNDDSLIWPHAPDDSQYAPT